MKYDNGIEKIYSTLTMLSDGVKFTPQDDFDRIKDVLPTGWRNHNGTGLIVFNSFLRDLKSYPNHIWISEVRLEKGLLRFYSESEHEHLKMIFDQVAQIPARMSAKSCMVCGQKGSRRKTEKFWPALCRKHYIQYVNWLDENGCG